MQPTWKSLAKVLLLLSLCNRVAGTVNSTEVQGWTNEPDGRGTFSLLWSCLFTIFVCTWTTQNLRVGQGHVIVKAMGMIYATLAPEIYSAEAVMDWYDSRKLTKEMKALGHSDWTMTHSLFASNHGFSVKIDGSPPKSIEGTASFLRMIKEGHMPVPEITLHALRDRSKADALAKSIAVIQASWLVVQCIARRTQDLPISTLELTTIAFVACMLITSIAWWNNPRDIEFPIETKIGTLTSEQLDGLAREPRRLGDKNRNELSQIILFAAIGTMFGGIHCLGWNFHFPNTKESLLWRMASVSSTASLPILIIQSLFRTQYPPDKPHSVTVIKYVNMAVSPFMILYLTSRLILCVEAFTSLRAAPAGIYKTVDWVQFLPKWA
jgi:hypothetical protein